jgi:hypothetical protein
VSARPYRRDDVQDASDDVRISPDGTGLNLSFRTAVLLGFALITGTASAVLGYSSITHTMSDHSKAIAALEVTTHDLDTKVDWILRAYGADPSKVVKDANAAKAN